MKFHHLNIVKDLLQSIEFQLTLKMLIVMQFVFMVLEDL